MKKYIELDRITDDISTCIVSGKELTQEQIFSFMENFIADSGSFFDAIKTKSYKAMRGLLNELWQYREWEDMSSEQAFLCGQLYGCVKLCEYREQSRQDALSFRFLLSKYADSKLFYIVKKNPGIRHKDLAKEIGLSTGRLSQMMDDEGMEELLISRVFGREKYYFLSARGEELFQKIEAQKRKAKKAEKQKRKTELEKTGPLESILMDHILVNTNVNTLPDLDISKTNPVIQRRLEGVFKIHGEAYGIKKINYMNLKNELSMGKTVEEGKECLTEGNSYYGQSTNLLRNGLSMSSAR